MIRRAAQLLVAVLRSDRGALADLIPYFVDHMVSLLKYNFVISLIFTVFCSFFGIANELFLSGFVSVKVFSGAASTGRWNQKCDFSGGEEILAAD